MLLGAGLVAAIALVLGLLTFDRTKVYHDARTLWQDTADKDPENAHAHNNLCVLLRPIDVAEAIRHGRAAVKAKPSYAKAHSNLAGVLHAAGQLDEAITHYQAALALKPQFQVHNDLALALAMRNHPGDANEALNQYQQALMLNGDTAEVHHNFGCFLGNCRQLKAAIAEFHEAVRCNAQFAEAYCDLGKALDNCHRPGEALVAYEQALPLAVSQGKETLAQELRSRIQRTGSPNRANASLMAWHVGATVELSPRGGSATATPTRK